MDQCINCGKEHQSKIWGAKCDCKNPNVVHIEKCNGCDNVIGIIIDDDHCGAEKLYCSNCIKNSKS